MIKFPALRVFILICFGITLSYLFPNQLTLFLKISFALCFLFILASALAFRFTLCQFFSNLLYIPSFIFLLASYSSFRINYVSKDHILNYANSNAELKTTVFQVQKKKSLFILEVQVDSVMLKKQEGFRSTIGKIRVNFLDTLFKEKNFRQGDFFQFRCRLTLPSNHSLQSDFNFKKFLFSKNIYINTFIRKNQVIESQAGMFDILNLDTWITSTYHYFSNAIDKLLPECDERMFIKGVLLGDRSSISKEVMTAFRKTGTIHALSISGMHIALIVFLLNILFQRLKITFYGKWVSFLFISGILIFYSLLTGWTPPVVRATVMSICFMLAPVLGKKSYPINTIFFSASFLLLLNPQNFFDLSYYLTLSAVFGLFWIYPKLIEKSPKQVKRNYFWKAICVTVSASLMIVPFSAYFFGNIPLLGSLANLIIVDLISVAIYSSFPAILLANVWDYAAHAYAIVAYYCTHVSIRSVIWFNELPYSSLAIKVSPTFFIAFFLLVAFLFSSLKWRWKYFILFLMTLNVSVWASIFSEKEKEYSNKITFSKIGKSPCIIHKTDSRYLVFLPNKNTSTTLPDVMFNPDHALPKYFATFLSNNDAIDSSNFQDFNYAATQSSFFLRTRNISFLAVRPHNITTIPRLNASDIIFLLYSRFSKRDLHFLEKLLNEKNRPQIITAFEKSIPAFYRRVFFNYIKRYQAIHSIERNGAFSFSF